MQLAVYLNKYSFCWYQHASSFCTKINLRENGLFAPERAIGEEKGTHNVKKHT